VKVAFAGTPDFAATILRGLNASDHEVGLVVSQPDPRKGRGRKYQPTPVAQLAGATGLPLRQPARISEVAEEISHHDALIVAAYGQILRPDTLYAAREGAWNVHASLLPNYRGAAPVERAIMEGESQTGITIMRMDEGLDTGPIALQRSVEIPPDMTGGELTELLAHVGAKAVVDGLTSLQDATLTLVEQDNLHATYASKLTDEDKFIRWETGVEEVHDLIRALSPHIGARASHPGAGGPVKIWRSRIADDGDLFLNIGEIYAENGRIVVGCGAGLLEVLELQMPAARRLRAHDFLLGNTLRGAFAT
jgi:methionyl-tRNA formyltransferase